MPQAGKLIPLAEYKKPLLQLTKADKARIAELKKDIRTCQYQMQPYEDQLRISWLPESDKAVCRFHIADLTREINKLHEQIREVKVDRYQEQLNLLV